MNANERAFVCSSLDLKKNEEEKKTTNKKKEVYIAYRSMTIICCASLKTTFSTKRKTNER